MRNPMRRAGMLMLLVLFTMPACASLGRPTPLQQQYVLGADRAAVGAAAPGDPAGLAIGVRRLDLAPYLASPFIIVRRGAHQIVVSEFHRWAEDPAEGISRAFASHLAAIPPVRAVDVAPWRPRTQHDYLVQLHVSRFEGVADSLAQTGEVQVAASWEILRPQEGTVLARGDIVHRQDGWTVGDFAELVSLLDVGLNFVARDVAACLQRVLTTPPAAPSEARDQPLACPGTAASAAGRP